MPKLAARVVQNPRFFTTTTTENLKCIRPYKLPKLLIPIRLLCSSSLHSHHQPRHRSMRSSPTSISNRSHTDFRIILWTSAYITVTVCVCVYVSGWMSQVCTQNGGRTRHFVQLPRCPCAASDPQLIPCSTSALNVVVASRFALRFGVLRGSRWGLFSPLLFAGVLPVLI